MSRARDVGTAFLALAATLAAAAGAQPVVEPLAAVDGASPEQVERALAEVDVFLASDCVAGGT